MRGRTSARILGFGFFIVAATTLAAASVNTDWRFLRADEPNASSPSFDDHTWEAATLPHTARVESLVSGKNAPQWQGVCWYRKQFDLSADARGKDIFLRFEGAMNIAEFWVNGQSAGKFQGGYLPCVMDISQFARPGEKNTVAVRLDNRDNPITGPKPLADLDFNLYGGLYRGASLVIKDKLHLTDSVFANKVAGGGIFVTFPVVSKQIARVRIQTHVQNDDRVQRRFVLKTTLWDANGLAVTNVESPPIELAANADRDFVQEFPVVNPKLWSPNSPYLYQIRSELNEQGRLMDTAQTRIGIRRIEISENGFRINGDKMFLRGANRHQEYPYIGNALSDDAQYRDAREIKEAGFDYLRLSHYPQSPAFLDACDELGIVVMDSILGWQYFGKDPAFAELKLRECRELIRRDRNHPCVILWEVSLNESGMPKSFIQKAHSIAHEEFPGDQCYTCGWTKGYDVFLQARQHGGCHKVKDVPCVISEYGDWEYFAQNAGLEQDKWQDLQPAERSSRQLRQDGEIRLLQQALNFQEAHNDDLTTPAFADGIWVMFDYNRGYAPDIESSGVMDIFRLPKFGYWFFRSQRDADEIVAGQPAGPMVQIANYWMPDSPREIRVFSNCEEVALYLNGKLIERRHPDSSRVSTHLKHPPVTFKLERFEPGTLRAIGYLAGREAATAEARTPGAPIEMKLRFALSGRPFAVSGKDAIFCRADLQDKQGVLVPAADAPVCFGSTGSAHLVCSNTIPAEAGTATVMLESDIAQPHCALYALSLVNEQGHTRVLSAAGSPDGTAPPSYELHYTTDGTEPSAASPVYSIPLENATQLRVAIIVQGLVVASADSRSNAASAHEIQSSLKAAAR